jgi:hypothetical protein
MLGMGLGSGVKTAEGWSMVCCGVLACETEGCGVHAVRRKSKTIAAFKDDFPLFIRFFLNNKKTVLSFLGFVSSQ